MHAILPTHFLTDVLCKSSRSLGHAAPRFESQSTMCLGFPASTRPVGTWRTRAEFWEVNVRGLKKGVEFPTLVGQRCPPGPPRRRRQWCVPNQDGGRWGGAKCLLETLVLAKRQHLIRLGPSAEKNNRPLIGHGRAFWGRGLTLRLFQPGSCKLRTQLHRNNSHLYRRERGSPISWILTFFNPASRPVPQSQPLFWF